jgi:beta-lactam-binding protein with PASTA domain
VRLGSSLRRRHRPNGGTHWSAAVGWLRGNPLVRKVVMGVSAGLAGLALGFLVATRALFPAPEPPSGLVSVPDLRGLDAQGAAGRLGILGLVVGQEDSLRHPSVERGRVLGQSPLPGQLALPGAEVALTYSSGPDRRLVPSVTRLDGEGARAVLEASGFTVEVDTLDSDEPKDRVVITDPVSGTEVTLPATVRIGVSRGPPMVPVPDLIGLTEEDAVALLDSLGFEVSEVQTRFRFGLDQGIVVDQSPSPGTLVVRGGAVMLGVGERSRPDDLPPEGP